MRIFLALIISIFLTRISYCDDISFIKDIAPILKERCFACHDAKKKSGKYDMSNFEKLMAGGVNGEAIVPGKPEDSEFHELMVTKEDRRMPPRDKGEAVPQAQADLIAKWIKNGAKLDASIDAKADIVRELRNRWTPPTPPKSYRFPAVVNALAFSKDGKQLATGGYHELLIWDADNGKLLKRLPMRAERAYAILYLSDNLIAVAGGRPGQEGDVVIFDLSKDGKPTKLFESDDSVLCLALSNDGKQIAAGGTDRAIRIWNLSSNPSDIKLQQTIENHADWVLGVAFSPDGKKILSAGRDKLAKIYDLEKKEAKQSVPDHQSTVYAVAWRNDGSAGYSVGADRYLRMWKVGGDGKQIRSTAGHGDEVLKVALSPDGKLIVTGSTDKSVRIWDSDKLGNVKTLTGLDDVVYAVAFSPDGKRVAGGAFNGKVQIWSLDGKVVSSFLVKP